MAEVYRAGIEAVPRGQTEAARSVGMSHGQAMRYIIVPQAVRKVIPPLLNDFIALMKDTSLVSVIGALEVVQAGFDVQTAEFNGSALVLGALFFLAVTIPLARVVDWLISREQAKTQRGAGPGPGEGAGRQNPPDRRRPGWRGRRVAAMEADAPIAAGAGAPSPIRAPMLSLENVCKRFGDLEVLRGVNVDVKRGEVVCVIGPSGSGKSTLLRCVNLLEPPEEGRILLEGKEITGKDAVEGIDFVRRRVGMVFQQFNLFPHKSALENVCIAQEKVLDRS